MSETVVSYFWPGFLVVYGRRAIAVAIYHSQVEVEYLIATYHVVPSGCQALC